MPPSDVTAATAGVVVFDGDCRFCTWSADRLRGWSSGRLLIVPWQRADLQLLGLTAEQCAEAVQYVSGGRHSRGGAAVAQALLACQQPWRSAGQVLALPQLAPLTERVYRLVAANRHRLPGSTPACRL